MAERYDRTAIAAMLLLAGCGDRPAGQQAIAIVDGPTSTPIPKPSTGAAPARASTPPRTLRLDPQTELEDDGGLRPLPPPPAPTIGPGRAPTDAEWLQAQGLR